MRRLPGRTRSSEIGLGDIRYRVVGEGNGLACGPRRIGNVDLMLEGIEGALCVRVNRVSPELVSPSAGRNPHGTRCMSNNPIRNLLIFKEYLLVAYVYPLVANVSLRRIICRLDTSYDKVNEIVFKSNKYYK